MILLDPNARPVVAHRGASGEYPENTLLAFERGLEQGADAIEFDVRVTREGIPVVIHDGTVDRTADGTGEVDCLSCHDVCSFDLGAGQKIPTLEHVFESFPGVPMIIEIKEEAASEPTLRTIERCGVAKRTLVGSFDHGALKPFRKAAIDCSASRRDSTIFWLAARLGWAMRGRGYGAFTVPAQRGAVRVVDVHFTSLAAKRAKPVHVWTIDARSDAMKLRALGVAGIITNFPAHMRDLIS